MITIFKTNISSEEDVNRVAETFNTQLSHISWTVDLLDIDRILRTESTEHAGDVIVKTLQKLGFSCTSLEVFYAPPHWI